jgi:hypothetical protein
MVIPASSGPACVLIVRAFPWPPQSFGRRVAVVVFGRPVDIAQRRLLLVTASQSSAADVGRILVHGASIGASIAVIAGFGLRTILVGPGRARHARPRVALAVLFSRMAMTTNAEAIRPFRRQGFNR